MNRLLAPAIVAACLAVGVARSEEPKLPANANIPTVAIGSASEADGKVTVRLRVYESTPTTEERTITVVRQVTVLVDGKPVIKEVPVTEKVAVVVMKPTRWREVKLSAADPGVEVRDLAGKLVPVKDLPKLLAKDSAILLSTSGPVDPFHLQLAKEGTLVVIVPPDKAGLAPGGIAPVAPGAPPGRVVAPPPPPPPPVVPPKVVKD
jgi:hypothetical protein